MRVGLMIAASVLGLWSAPVTPAYADSYVDCSSSGYARNYCPVSSGGRVWLDYQYSNSNGACIENRSWGWDGRGIWVDRGCRGRFRVEDRYGDEKLQQAESLMLHHCDCANPLSSKRVSPFDAPTLTSRRITPGTWVVKVVICHSLFFYIII